jgi:hypothetical protein
MKNFFETSLLGSAETGSKHDQLIMCQSLYLSFWFSYLYSHATRTLHHEFQKTVLRQRQDGILESKSGSAEENSGKAEREEDNIKE